MSMRWHSLSQHVESIDRKPNQVPFEIRKRIFQSQQEVFEPVQSKPRS
jgi:hypothetical protein